MQCLTKNVVRTLFRAGVMPASVLCLVALLSARVDAQDGQGEDSAPVIAAGETSDESAAELGVVATPSPGRGIHVAETVWLGPAARAGIRRGDYIMSVDGEDVSQPADLRELIQRTLCPS